MKHGTILTIFAITAWMAGHYAYQWMLGAPNWDVALERSFFTATAQAALWMALRKELKDEAS